MTSVWPTEVSQCAMPAIDDNPLSQLERNELFKSVNNMFLDRIEPQYIERYASIMARRNEIINCVSGSANHGLVVVGFAGGGGSCEGIKKALGYSPHIAMNHNPIAMSMHAMNHPETLHYPEDIFSVDPSISTGGLPVFLSWFSPDCCHFSKARGATPVKKEIRGLAWVILRWVLDAQPVGVMLENVEEFKTWGPLITLPDGGCIPDKKRKGETFFAFVGMLSTGIDENHPALTEACEFLKIGTDSPEAKRLVKGLGYDVDYKEIIASDHGTPTSRKRLYLVARRDGRPVVFPEPSHGDPKSEAFKSGKLKLWKTAADCINWSIPCPSIFSRKKPLANNTLRRIAKGTKKFVIDNPSPFIIKCNHTSNKTAYDCFRGQSLDEPMQTITQTHGFALATPYIARIGQTGFGGDRMQYEVTEPLTTITSKGEHLLIAPFIARQFGNSIGHEIDQPNGTVTAGGGGKSQLATAHLIKLRGTCKDGQSVTEPMPTITAGGLHVGKVQAFLTKYNGTGEAIPITEPMHTVTSRDRFGLTEAYIVEEPATDEQRLSAWWCARFIEDYTDIKYEPDLFPEHRKQYITVGDNYIIYDFGMRMLWPRELYNANGFPADYIIDRDVNGKAIAKSEQVSRCGNAVCPPVAEALVRANFPEMCVKNDCDWFSDMGKLA